MSERSRRRKQAERRSSRVVGHLVSQNTARSGGLNELVPYGFDTLPLLQSREVRGTLRWMKQKDDLEQDMILLGGYGPLRRWIALRYCEERQREVEYIALTQDTTEADLKQRREITAAGDVVYQDLAVVQAALHGRILILEGLEKAERNVLPIINNLLENREMALEDGRFLVEAKRYDDLARHRPAAELHSFVRVHPAFRVVAVAVPVPPFPGNPLDPPLRSRFQARLIRGSTVQNLAGAIRRVVPDAGALPQVKLLLAMVAAVREVAAAQATAAGSQARDLAYRHLPDPGEAGIVAAAVTCRTFGECGMRLLLQRAYPWGHIVFQEEARELLASVLARLNTAKQVPLPRVIRIARRHPHGEAMVSFHVDTPPVGGGAAPHEVQVTLTPGPGDVGLGTLFESLTPPQQAVFSGVCQSFAASRPVCLLGSHGEGKSRVGQALAEALGHVPTETVFLYADMTARDLLQRRTTGPRGETVWVATPLVSAVARGGLVVLDGLHRLPPGTSSILLRLLEDGEITLFDGTRFVKATHYASLLAHGASHAELARRRVFRVHEAFRCLALATPPERGSGEWLGTELMHLFDFHDLESYGATSYAAPGHMSDLLLREVPSLGAAVASSLAAAAAALEARRREEIREGTASQVGLTLFICHPPHTLTESLRHF